MPGDELHEEAGGSVTAVPDAGHGRVGGRHAAPRKSLYSRLHLPAGKAIAIAAMPSAVLMGMGLTPQLANAKPMPKNPFKSGNCVSQEDREDEAKEEKKEEEQKKAAAEQKEKVAKAKEAKEKEAKEQKRKAEQEKKESSSAGSDDSDGSGSSQDSDNSKDSGVLGSDDQQDDSQKSDNPLDPLGVGDKLGNALNPDKDKDAQDDKDASGQDGSKDSASQDSSGQQSKSGSAQGSSGDSGSKSSDAGEDGDAGKKGEDLTKPVGDSVNKVGDGVKDTTGTVGKKVEDAAKEAGKTTEQLPSAAKGDNSGGNGKSYPCVEEKKSDGKDERTQATLPNDPWELESSKLSLHGLNYEGVVNVTTASGGKKQALKFTADSVDIGDLHQIVQGPGGTKYHVRAEKGSTSTIRDGKVTLYTEKLEGNLFGLIPIVFDPEHPPPLNVPEAMFTNVKIKQAGQFGGNLTVPGLHQSISN